MQIPNVQKSTYDLTVFLCIWDIFSKKATCKILVKLTSLINFSNILKAAFALTFFGPKNQAQL